MGLVFRVKDLFRLTFACVFFNAAFMEGNPYICGH